MVIFYRCPEAPGSHSACSGGPIELKSAYMLNRMAEVGNDFKRKRRLWVSKEWVRKDQFWERVGVWGLHSSEVWNKENRVMCLIKNGGPKLE